MSARPLIVLAGWLGAQPKALKKYELMYQALGMDVISHIAEPRMVVGHSLSLDPIQIPKDWPFTNEICFHPSTMQQLAWYILAQIYAKQSAFFLFHSFSNGGCFLWESIRRVLDRRNEFQQPVREILTDLYTRIKGIVFDSCPAWFGDMNSSLRPALKYCTRLERLHLALLFGPGVVLYDGEHERIRSCQRCNDYFQFLKEDDLDIPQLYLCSKDDLLCDYAKVDEMVHHRRKKQKSHVFFRAWEKSVHCSHLRIHPKEYKEAIETFADLALLRSKL